MYAKLGGTRVSRKLSGAGLPSIGQEVLKIDVLALLPFIDA